MKDIIAHYWYIIGLSIGILSLLLWGIVYFLPVIGKRIQRPIYKEENKDLIIEIILIMLLKLDEYYYKKVGGYDGSSLCFLVIKLYKSNILPKEQFLVIRDYIDYNQPKKGFKFYSNYSKFSGYYWPSKDIEIRRKWLIYQLNLLTNTY